MILIAHRGLHNKDIGENTISAFDNAFQNKYKGIELDIRKTKDNEIVVIHDSFISRVSDGKGLVKNKTYDELIKYNFGKSTIERIPILNDVINRYNDKIMFIELKEKISLKQLNLNDRNTYYISSFNYDYIKDIPKSSKYKRGIINNTLNTNINLDNIDFIMILDVLLIDSVYEFYNDKGIEVTAYGKLGVTNLKLKEKYKKNIKYVT